VKMQLKMHYYLDDVIKRESCNLIGLVAGYYYAIIRKLTSSVCTSALGLCISP